MEKFLESFFNLPMKRSKAASFTFSEGAYSYHKWRASGS